MANPQDWMSLLRMLQQQQQAQRGMGYPGMPNLPQLPGMPIQGPQVGGGGGRPPIGNPGRPSWPGGIEQSGLPNFIPGRSAHPGRPWQAPLPGYNPGEQTMPVGQPPMPRFDNGPLTAGAKVGAGVGVGAAGGMPGGVAGAGPFYGGMPPGMPYGVKPGPTRDADPTQGRNPFMPQGPQGGPLPGLGNYGQQQGLAYNTAAAAAGNPPPSQGVPQGFQEMIERLRQMYMGMPQGNQVDLMGRPIMNGGWT